MTFHHFQRKSGLVRQLNVRDVFLVNTFGYALGIALTINPVLIGGFAPSANIFIVLTGGLIAALFNGFTYGLFAAVMPKSGGDYVYVTRTLGNPIYGFVASVGFTLAQLYGFALNSYWAFAQAIAPGLATIGTIVGNPNLIHASTRIGEENVALVLALVLMILVFGAACLGLSFARKLFVVAFIFAMIGPLVQAYAFFSVDHATFVSLFDAFLKDSHLSSLNYQGIVDLGRQQGFAPHPGSSLTDSMRALPFGFLMFLGFTYSAYMGSEVKEASRSQLIGIFSALGVGALFFYLVLGRYFAVVGQDFNAALSAKGVGLPAGTSLAFFAGIIVKSKLANVLMNIGNILWFLLVPLVILQVCSRNIQVWAVDYRLPERFSRSNRFDAPAWAAFVGLIGAVVLLFLSYAKHTYTPLAAVALSAGSILMTGVAAILHARKNDTGIGLFSRGFFAFLGCGTVIVFGLILYTAVAYPEISGGEEFLKGHGVLATVLFIAVVYAAAAIWFVLSRRRLKQQLSNEGLSEADIWSNLPED